MIIDERLSVYIDSLSWNLPDYLKTVEREALREEVPIIRKPMQSLLGFLLRIRKPSAILEIGTAVGFSSMWMSENVAENVPITTIEKVPMRIKQAKINWEQCGKTQRIQLLEGDANQVLEDLVQQKRQYDFIFMDAAKGQYMNFLIPIEKLLTPGGMLVTDNVLQEGDIVQSRYAITRRDRTIHGRMREYLYHLTHTEEWDTVILPVGDGVTLSIKNDNSKQMK